MRTVISIATLSMLTMACDQLAATVSAASIVTRTPDLANAQGMQSSGLATVLPLNGLGTKAGTAALVAVGERETATSTAAPAPVGGALVQIVWAGLRVSLCEGTDGGAGTYQATNVAGQDCHREGLDYIENETYRTNIETGSDLHTMAVLAPAPIVPSRVSFSPQLSVPGDVFGATLPSHSRNTQLAVDWSADPVAAERHAFVTVARVLYVGGAGPNDALSPSSWQADPTPVWDNFPATAGEMIDVVSSDPEPSITVDGAAFNETGVYILVVTTTEISDEVSTNLFLGSNALAGAGTAFVFWVD